MLLLAENSQPDSTDIAFEAESLLSIDKGLQKFPTSNLPNTTPVKLYIRQLWNSLNVASKINTKSTSTPIQRTRRYSPSPQALETNALGIPLSRQRST